MKSNTRIYFVPVEKWLTSSYLRTGFRYNRITNSIGTSRLTKNITHSEAINHELLIAENR